MTRLVVMGVAGCGKSAVGAALAAAMALAFRDGDDLHPAENIAKMSMGHPLTDADRWPWLSLVGQALAPGALIIGCSALKRGYRDFIAQKAGVPVTFVHLAGSRAVIDARPNRFVVHDGLPRHALKDRHNHDRHQGDGPGVIRL